MNSKSTRNIMIGGVLLISGLGIGAQISKDYEDKSNKSSKYTINENKIDYNSIDGLVQQDIELLKKSNTEYERIDNLKIFDEVIGKNYVPNQIPTIDEKVVYLQKRSYNILKK